jgi:hypothetical protein
VFKNLPYTSFYSLILLIIPFIGTLVSNEVNWSLFDFVVMGVLLFSTSVGVHHILKRTKTLVQRNFLIASILLVFLFIWVELAVGIVGSPFAGD